VGSAQTIIATSIATQAMQMENPSAAAIWSRAIEIFEGEELAREWMNHPLPILGDHTPKEYADSGDAEKQREVLTILARLDYGMFS
jgi:putative toxin-antitoxin system antitoxin component (TIGR02293 family)